MEIKDQKEFPVDSASLKDVRNFARGLFDQVSEFEDNKEELVLALAEAAQNIVKHAYSGKPSGDTMRVEIQLLSPKQFHQYFQLKLHRQDLHMHMKQ